MVNGLYNCKVVLRVGLMKWQQVFVGGKSDKEWANGFLVQVFHMLISKLCSDI